MKEYEILIKYFNACSGMDRPRVSLEEAELENTDEFVQRKHGDDFSKFQKEVLEDGRIVYTYNGGSIGYTYEFTEV